MARIENISFDEISPILGRELEINAPEESDNMTTTTMTSPIIKSMNLLSNGLLTDTDFKYCKEKGHMIKDEKNSKRKRKGRSKRPGSIKENLELGNVARKKPS